MKKNSLISNIAYNGTFQVFNLIIPLITLPYVARIFNPTVIGTYSYTLSFIQIFILMSGFGILNYGSRAIALAQEKEERSKTFTEIWIMQIGTTLISFLILVLIILFVLPYKNIFLLQALLVLVNMFEISWLFIGVENFKNVAIRNIFLKLTVTCLIFIFIKHENQLGLYILINVFSTLVGNLLMFAYISQYVTLKKVNFNALKKHVKPAFLLLLPQLITLVYTTLDKTLLGSFSTQEQVGFYDQAQKIIRVSIAFLGSISTVLMPRMTSLIALNNQDELKKLFEKTIKYTSLLSILIVCIILVISNRFVIWFFGVDYKDVGILMTITSIIGILIPITVLVGNAILIPYKKESAIVKSSIYASIASFALNIMLDNKLGALGACIALIIAEIIAFISRTHYAKKVLQFSIFDKEVMKMLIAAGISLILGFTSLNLIDNYFLSIVFASVIITVTYFIALYFLKLEVINEGLYVIRNKIIRH